MSEETMDSGQRTVENHTDPAHDPQARTDGFLLFALVLIVLAMSTAVYLKLEDAERLLEAASW